VAWSLVIAAWLAFYLGVGLILLVLGVAEIGFAVFGGIGFWHRLAQGAAGLIFLGLCTKWFKFGAAVLDEMTGGYAAIWKLPG